MEHKLSKAQQDAKAYVERHQLEKVVGQMLNALVHSKDPSPITFMIKHLASLSNPQELAQAGITIQGQPQNQKQEIQFPEFPESCSSLLRKYLTRDLWEKFSKNHSELYNCIKPGLKSPEENIGIYATNSQSYSSFDALFHSIAEEFHNWNRSEGHKNRVDFGGFSSSNLDESGKYLKSTKVRVNRNFQGVAFPCGATSQDRETVEKRALDVLNERMPGTYVPLSDESGISNLRLEPPVFVRNNPSLECTNAYQEWPKNRGIYVNENYTTYVKINGEDHLKIFSINKGGDIESAWNNVIEAILSFQKNSNLAYNETLGYLTSCPSNLGTGMKITFIFHVPQLIRSGELRGLLSNYGVGYKEIGIDLVEVFNIKRLGINEVDIAINMAQVAKEIIRFEKSSSGEDQEQIAQMPEFSGSQNSLAAKYWNPDVWRQIHDKKTSNGFTAVSCINPDSKAKFGIVAKDAECYRAFDNLFKNVIDDYYGKDMAYKEGYEVELPAHDPNSEFVQNLRIKLSRNIKGEKLVPGMNDEDRTRLEQTLRPILQKIEGRYLDMETATESDKEELGLYFPAEPGKGVADYALSAQNWPQGRACLICPNKSYIWVNAKEHIEIVVIGYGSELQNAWNRAYGLLSQLQQDLEFEFDSEYGYLNSVVSEIGTGANISAFIQFPQIAKHPSLDDWAIEHELDIKKRDDGKSIVIFEKPRLGKSAAEIVTKFNNTIKQGIEWEKELQLASYPSVGGTFLGDVLTDEVWENYKNTATSEGHSFYRHIAVEVPEIGFNCCSADTYSQYSPLIDSLCKMAYNLNENSEKYQKNLTVPELVEPDADGKYIKSVRLTAYRNVSGFSFTPAMWTTQREQLEGMAKDALSQLQGELAGEYTPTILISKSDSKRLIAEGELFTKPTCGRDGDWPGYRGVFKNSTGDFIAWINAQEHITLISKSSGSQIIPRIQQLVDALTQLEASLSISTHEQYGYLSSSIANIGTALDLTATLSLSKAPQEANFDSFCAEKFLKYTNSGEDLQISYTRKLDISEAQSFTDFIAGLKNLVDWEDQLNSN